MKTSPEELWLCTKELKPKMIFVQFFKIIFIFWKYRLDLLLPELNLNLFFKILYVINPLRLIPARGSKGERLFSALLAAGPVYVKLGQILSTRSDFFDDEIIHELTNFQSNLPTFDSRIAVRIIEDDLGKPIEELFESFQGKPLAAASIAQVHEAVLFSGEEVVVKVIRPNIQKEITKNLGLIKLISKLLDFLLVDAQRLQLKELVQEYEIVIQGEVDLKRESANTRLTAEYFENSKLLYVPKVFSELSGSQTLTIEKIKGVPITDFKTLDKLEVDRKLLSERGVSIFFKQVFEDNFFHADMHPGNIFVDVSNPKSPTYINVDYAICGSLSDQEQFFIGKMLSEMFSQNFKAVAETMIRAGWVDNKTSPLELEITVRTFLEPIIEKPFDDINFGEMLFQFFDSTRKYNLSLPPSLLLLEKTLINIEGLGKQIYPQLDLWVTAKPFIQEWIKAKYNPARIFKKIHDDAGFLIEKAVNLPSQIANLFDAVDKMENYTAELQDLRKEVKKSERRRSWQLFALAFLLILIIFAVI